MSLYDLIFESDERFRSAEREFRANAGDYEKRRAYIQALRRQGDHEKANEIDPEHHVGKFVKAYKNMQQLRAVARTRKGKPGGDRHATALADAEANVQYAASDAHEAHPEGNPGEHLHGHHFDSPEDHVKALAHLHDATGLEIDSAGAGTAHFRQRAGGVPTWDLDNAKRFAHSINHHYGEASAEAKEKEAFSDAHTARFGTRRLSHDEVMGKTRRTRKSYQMPERM